MRRSSATGGASSTTPNLLRDLYQVSGIAETVPAGTRHPFSMSFAASATMTSYASRSVLSLMQAALDAVPLLAAAPGVAASIAGTLAAWC